MAADEFDLDAKYRREQGTVLLTGTQALVRLALDQRRADRRRGLNTATFISGYQGSPLGMLDITLERNAALLAEHDIVWVPGINEDLAASAIWGSQQPGYGPLDRHDGVVGMWYGKGPGLDRSGDVFKHANFMGVGRNGGVLALGGDDPLSKSSTLPTDVEPTFYDAGFPVLYPGTIQEVLDLGLHGFELSRFSGFWVGFKILTTIADGLSTIEVGADRFAPVHPDVEIDGRPWHHVQLPGVLAPLSLEQEKDMAYGRTEAAKAYAAANGLNQVDVDPAQAWLGLVAAGRTYYEMRQALHDMGLGDRELRDAGIRVLRLGMTYPLETGIVRQFASGLEEVVVVEEKRAFVELFVRDALYSLTDRPRVVGKTDERGARLIPVDGELTADRLAPLLAGRLARRLSTPRIEAHLAVVENASRLAIEAPLATRKPYFCSGCPHNRSTNVPEGSVDRWRHRLPRHGAVGWIAVPSTSRRWVARARSGSGGRRSPTAGTCSRTSATAHSSTPGSLAIRAASAAGVNITYKLLVQPRRCDDRRAGRRRGASRCPN